MSNRLDQERQARLEPHRMETCMTALRGYQDWIPKAVSHNEIHILNLDTQNTIKFWPYSGWHTGKDIEDGRGFDHLIKQIKEWQPRIEYDVREFNGGLDFAPKHSPWWKFWDK